MEIGSAIAQDRQARLEREQRAAAEEARQRKIREERERVRLAEERERKRIEQLERERKAELERQRLAKIKRQQTFMSLLKDNDMPVLTSNNSNFSYVTYKVSSDEALVYKIKYLTPNNELPFKRDVVDEIVRALKKKQTNVYAGNIYLEKIYSSESNRDYYLEQCKGKAFAADIKLTVFSEPLVFCSASNSNNNNSQKKTDFWGDGKKEKTETKSNSGFWD